MTLRLGVYAIKDEFADDKDVPGLSGARTGLRPNFPDLEPYDFLTENTPGEETLDGELDTVEIDFESLTAAVRKTFCWLTQSFF